MITANDSMHSPTVSTRSLTNTETVEEVIASVDREISVLHIGAEQVSKGTEGSSWKL